MDAGVYLRLGSRGTEKRGVGANKRGSRFIKGNKGVGEGVAESLEAVLLLLLLLLKKKRSRHVFMACG